MTEAICHAGVKLGHWGEAKAGQFAVCVERDVPRPARRRWLGFRSRGGCGIQELLMVLLASGSADRTSRLFQPVALAVQLQNMDMVGETIEQCAGKTLALKDTRPFLEWEIRGDNG